MHEGVSKALVTSTTPIPIGRKVQGALEQLQQTPAWLADKIGVPRSTITRVLKGERNPTPETLQEIAVVLGITVAQLASGTDAAERVKEAKDLVARSDYEDVLRQYIAQEGISRDQAAQIRDMRIELDREREASRRARDDARRASEESQAAQAACDGAERRARQHEFDAQRYREALEKAVADVAQLREHVRELGKAVDASRKTGRVAAALAAVAAAASVATYLNAEPQEQEDPKKKSSPRKKETK